MNHRVQEAFGQIRAEQALMEDTRAFLKEKTKGYTRAELKMARRGPFVGAVSCACLLFALLCGRWLYFTPTAEISIDINPSIELGVNRFDCVISINGFNDDGWELANALNIKFRKYTEAIEQILGNDTIASLLSEDEIMAITVAGTDGAQTARMLSEIEACTAGNGNTYCDFAHHEEAAAAHETGLSCGKYKAFLRLQALDPDITPEAVQGMTMREILDMIDSLSPGYENGTYHDGGNGHHHGEGSGHR